MDRKDIVIMTGCLLALFILWISWMTGYHPSGMWEIRIVILIPFVALAGIFLWLLRRERTVRMGSQRSNWKKGILAGIIVGALILVLDLLCDYFGFPRSPHEPYGEVVQIAIIVCAAFAASFISRRIVEWKTGPPAESGDS
jgi:O-antigen/teichoic acid export membrane protein